MVVGFINIAVTFMIICVNVTYFLPKIPQTFLQSFIVTKRVSTMPPALVHKLFLNQGLLFSFSAVLYKRRAVLLVVEKERDIEVRAIIIGFGKT